jgi:hypothetical protein
MLQKAIVFALLISTLWVRAEAIIMSEDGAWCWFQDPRAVFIQGEHTRTYAQWITHDGQLQMGTYDHDTKETQVFTIKENWGRNDHNVGSILVLPDNRIMIFYAQHNGRGIYCRISAVPETILAWDDEVSISTAGRITYSHPVYLRAENRFYVFWRASDWNPAFATSTDGLNWTKPRTLIRRPGARPYLKVFDDGQSSIHLTFTDGHPRNEAQNALYYMHYKEGNFHKASGEFIGSMAELPFSPQQTERVYDGSTAGRAWVWDITLDHDQRPVIAYTRLPAETDHRYCYARWTGDTWLDSQLTEGGKWFPQTPPDQREKEPHYSGGMALDHANPSIVYLSRPIDGQFEIERWDTKDFGQTWHAQAITRQSEALNVRPVVPRGHKGQTSSVLWMHGTYTHFTNYRTAIKFQTIQHAETP